MSLLDNMPSVDNFLGTDLKTGSLIISVICMLTPLAHGCTFFMALSYLLVTTWILVALYFAASVILFFGVQKDDAHLCIIWIWYSIVYVVLMMILMVLLAIAFTSRKQRCKVLCAIIGMLWYLLTIYFIIVVNSHRKSLEKEKMTEDS